MVVVHQVTARSLYPLQIWGDEFEKKRKEAVAAEREHARRNGQLEQGKPVASARVDGGYSLRTYGHGFNAKSGVVSVLIITKRG